MANFRENIQAEFENISDVLSHLPSASALPELSPLELAGVSTFLNNFYNGVENILKQGLTAKSISKPVGSTWHRDLLHVSSSSGLISAETMACLAPYLAFRHFAIHGYAIDLDPDKLLVLLEDLDNTFRRFKSDIAIALK